MASTSKRKSVNRKVPPIFKKRATNGRANDILDSDETLPPSQFSSSQLDLESARNLCSSQGIFLNQCLSQVI